MKNEDLYVYKKSDFYEDFISSLKEYYEREQVDTLLSEKDKEIAELKKKLMPCLNGDCILTCEVVEKYGKENAELKAKLETVNELIKTARQMLEDAKATHYVESVDAGMRERRLKRALWNLRACYADMMQKRIIECKCDGWVHRVDKWIEVERKCRAKADEYK